MKFSKTCYLKAALGQICICADFLKLHIPISSLRPTYMVESVYPLFRPFNSV